MVRLTAPLSTETFSLPHRRFPADPVNDKQTVDGISFPGPVVLELRSSQITGKTRKSIEEAAMPQPPNDRMGDSVDPYRARSLAFRQFGEPFVTTFQDRLGFRPVPSSHVDFRQNGIREDGSSGARFRRGTELETLAHLRFGFRKSS